MGGGWWLTDEPISLPLRPGRGFISPFLGWDAGVHRRFTPSDKFSGPFYTLEWRETQ